MSDKLIPDLEGLFLNMDPELTEIIKDYLRGRPQTNSAFSAYSWRTTNTEHKEFSNMIHGDSLEGLMCSIKIGYLSWNHKEIQMNKEVFIKHFGLKEIITLQRKYG